MKLKIKKNSINSKQTRNAVLLFFWYIADIQQSNITYDVNNKKHIEIPSIPIINSISLQLYVTIGKLYTNWKPDCSVS